MTAPLRLSGPCDEPWEDMTEAPNGRRCARCDRVVFDLTRATAREALGVATLFGGERLCARVRADAEGFPVFRRPEPRPSARRRLALVAVGLGAAACGAVPPPPVAPTATTLAPTPSPTPAPPAPPTIATASPRAADRDDDGVTDDLDQCPDRAGPPPTGCPRVVVTTSGDMTILQMIRFSPGETAITKTSLPILEATFEVIKAHPDIHSIEIHGHADALEHDPLGLSRRRAAAVVDWLAKKGLDRGRLIPIGDGSQKPLDSNATVEGRARNRRIEFRVIPFESVG